VGGNPPAPADHGAADRDDDPAAHRGNASQWSEARGRASVRGSGLCHRPVESAGPDHCAAGRRAAPQCVRGRGSRQARGRLPRRPHPASSVRQGADRAAVGRAGRGARRGHARALSDHGPHSGWARTPDRRAAGPPRRGRRLPAPHRANRVAVHPGIEWRAERAEDASVEADRPAAPAGRRRAGCPAGGVPGGRRRNDLHHREGRPARARLLRPQPDRSGGERGGATEGNDEPRPGEPLRQRPAGRR
jgi:hypothetical protein